MKRNQVVALISVCGLLGCAAWALGWFADNPYSDDPEVAKLEKLRDETMGQDREQRREARGQIRQAMEDMTAKQRSSFMESSMPIFVKFGAMQMEQRFDEFLAMTPEQQRREMDKRIDEQLARQKERQARQASGEDDRSRGRGRPPMSAEKRDEFRKKMQDWTTPEQRAKFETVISMYNQRREERGLEPVGGRGGGFFGGGR